MSLRDFLLLLAAAALIGGLIARRRACGSCEVAAWIILPAAVCGLTVACWATFRLLPEWSWSACRLAASLRLAWGFPLYTPVLGATINGWMYGPVAPMAYIPAALASEPQAALRIAMSLNVAYFLLPAVLLFLPWLRTTGARLWASLALVFCIAAHLAPFGLWYNAALLHVDCIAICLGVLSCLALARGHRFTLAAVLCVLAIGAKQTDAPLVMAQLFFLLRTAGARPALAYALRFAAAGVTIAAGFCAWFGAGTLWQNLVVVPGSFPFEWERAAEQLAGLAFVTWWMWPVAWLAGKKSPGPGNDDAAWLLLTAALFLLPGGFMAALKFGGGQNSLHSLAYGLLGATALLLRLALTPTPRITSCVRAALLLGVVAVLLIDLNRVFVYQTLQPDSPGRRHREAFQFARAHPGQTYFPWDTLVNLMAERRDYPFDAGVVDWQMAGAAPTAAAIRATLPPTLAFVIYSEKDKSNEMLKILPEFNQVRFSRPWMLYTRTRNPAAP